MAIQYHENSPSAAVHRGDFRDAYSYPQQQPEKSTLDYIDDDPRPFFGPWYLASVPGGLKIVQVAGSMATLVCILMIHGAAIGTYVACFTSLIAVVNSLILLVMYLYNLVHLCTILDVMYWEYLYTGAFTIMYGITTGFMVYSAIAWEIYRIPWGAAAVFALITWISFAVDFVQQVRNRRREQREIQMQNMGGERDNGRSQMMRTYEPTDKMAYKTTFA